ncbi:protein FAM185A [Betta splendens]|uniref:Protein FAM185A n=1 Tax=Betta splendens TaxID=158456 RepID=A0A6P7MUZ8_BETSP|nr:protein FAM185A [Betta splendens]
MFWSSAAAQRGCVPLLRRCSLTVRPRCTVDTSRTFSISASRSHAPDESKPRLKQWVLTVSPFATVRAQLGCSISVGPLDPHAFPEADRAFVTVHGADTELQVHYDEHRSELSISAEKVNSCASIDVAAPVKSSLFITTRGKGDVRVQKMESDICKVQTERGSCSLDSVKAHRVEVQSRCGSVTGGGTIHGNVDISTHGDGAVDVKKLQGTEMNVSTERGSLRVKAIYAESTCIRSHSGKVELGHVHGSATVTTVCGDAVIDGSNSFLKVSSQRGALDAYVGDGGSAELHSREGAVCVRVPSSLRAGVELCGASVEINSKVVLCGAENNTSQGQTTVTGFMNVESPVDQWVRARADRGSVTLKTQSWFESLKLGS